MEITVPFGPADVTLFAGNARTLDKLESAHVVGPPMTDAERELAHMYKDETFYAVRVRCDFKDSATPAERKAVSDALLKGMSEHVGKPSREGKGHMMYSYPFEEAARHVTFDMNNITLINREETKEFAQHALAGIKAAREEWWKSELGQPHADHTRLAVEGVLGKICASMGPFKRARAEELITEKVPAIQVKMGKVDPERKGAAFTYHMDSSSDVQTLLGSIGIDKSRSQELSKALGTVLYPGL